MNTKQSNIFWESEGDQWFQRNQHTIKGTESFFETNVVKEVLAPFKSVIKEMLEIGCGNGAKLSDLCNFFNISEGCGIDPSIEATKDGNSRFSNVRLKQGIASNLPFQDYKFDLVYIGWCSYLMDRGDIFKMIAEVDRVLRPGGFIAIHDFDPIYRHKRPYHHKKGLFSYKTANAEFFTASGHYYLVSKNSISSKTDYFQVDNNERVSLCVLYKEVDPYPTVL